MATKAGAVVIDIQGHTATFSDNMKKAEGSLRDFGSHGVTNVQAVSGALRVMEGNMTNNLRAAERFLANTLKLGPAMQAIFPLVGGLAFLGVIGELGKKVYEFFKTLKEQPEVANGAFRKLSDSLAVTDAELKVSNAELGNQIAKLSGQPGNGLKVALLEAVAAADKLKVSLDSDLKSLFELMKTQSGGWGQQFLNWFQGKGDLDDLRKRIGGITGEGGANADIAATMDAGIEKIQKAKSASDSQAAQQELLVTIQKKYNDLLDAANAKKAEFLKLQKGYTIPAQPVYGSDGKVSAYTLARGAAPTDETKNLEDINHDILVLTQQRGVAEDRIKNSILTQTKEIKEQANENAKGDNPYKNMIANMDAQIAIKRTQIDAIGKSDADQVQAKAIEIYTEKINALTISMKEKNKTVTAAEEAAIMQRATTEAQLDAEELWKQKVVSGTAALQQRIAEQIELNAAENSGYAQRRDFAVERQVKGEFGADYSSKDPSKQAVIQSYRQQAGNAYDLEHSPTSETNQLKIQAELYTKLASVRGNYGAVSAAEDAAEIAKLKDKYGDVESLTAAYEKFAAAKRADESAERTAQLKLATTAAQNITGAAFGGSDAIRRADLENRIAEAKEHGATADEISAMRLEDQAKHQQEIVTSAAKLVTEDTDRLQLLNEEIEALKKQIALNGQNVQLETALKQLESDRAKTAADQALQQGSLQSGLDAFFLQMQEKSENAGQILNTALNQALDQTSDNLADMLTGNKPKGEKWSQVWGKEFKDIGNQMVKSSMKSMMQQGLGALGKHFGIKPQDSKLRKDINDKSDPVHVYVTNQDQQQGSNNAVPNPLKNLMKGGGLGGLFGGGDQGGGIFSMLGGGSGGGIPSVTSGISFGDVAGGGADAMGGMSSLIGGGADASMDGMSALAGAFADGGNVKPGWAVVGEKGTEIAHFNGGGAVMSHDEMMRSFGGGDTHNHYYTIDAKGADLGAANRLDQAMKAHTQAAAKQATKTTAERAKRMPRGRR